MILLTIAGAYVVTGLIIAGIVTFIQKCIAYESYEDEKFGFSDFATWTLVWPIVFAFPVAWALGSLRRLFIRGKVV